MMNSFHNETLNAWTMVLGVGLIAAMNATLSQTNFLHWIMLAGIGIHLPLSFSYHALSCTKEYALLARELDIRGVIIASGFLAFALGVRYFKLNSVVPWILTTFNALLLMYRTILVDLNVANNTIDKSQRLYTTTTLALAVSIYNIPVVLLIWVPLKRTWAIIEVVTVVSAGFFYVTAIPESFVSKTFDLIGCSHQIAHVLLIVQQIAIWFLLVIKK